MWIIWQLLTINLYLLHTHSCRQQNIKIGTWEEIRWFDDVEWNERKNTSKCEGRRKRREKAKKHENYVLQFSLVLKATFHLLTTHNERCCRRRAARSSDEWLNPSQDISPSPTHVRLLLDIFTKDFLEIYFALLCLHSSV